MFVDSHCHLDCIKLDEFDHSFDRLMQKIAESGVEHMLCVSIDLDSYPLMLEKISAYPQVSVSVGVHPMADKSSLVDEQHLCKLASNEQVVAIGETGLDYYYNKGDREWQQHRFRQHLQCARKVNKPVIIHTRDAGADTLKILEQENASQYKGVIHCFTETLDFAERAMDMGFLISFSGIITFENAGKLRSIARAIPDEFLLIETDSPYLAPVPHRGKQNNSSFVKYVANVLAEVRGTTVEHIAEITRNNYYRMFG